MQAAPHTGLRHMAKPCKARSHARGGGMKAGGHGAHIILLLLLFLLLLLLLLLLGIRGAAGTTAATAAAASAAATAATGRHARQLAATQGGTERFATVFRSPVELLEGSKAAKDVRASREEYNAAPAYLKHSHICSQPGQGKSPVARGDDLIQALALHRADHLVDLAVVRLDADCARVTESLSAVSDAASGHLND